MLKPKTEERPDLFFHESKLCFVVYVQISPKASSYTPEMSNGTDKIRFKIWMRLNTDATEHLLYKVLLQFEMQSICNCVYVCMLVHVCMCVSVSVLCIVYLYVSVCMYLYVRNVCICMQVCVPVCEYMYVCMCVSLSICMYVCFCEYMYVYICM